MENGRIVEEGTHQELTSLKQMYYILYKYSNYLNKKKNK